MKLFHHQSLKNYTIALLDLFNDISVPRYNEDGSLLEEIKVPIQFGNRDKAFMLSDYDMENIHTGNVNIFPRMVLQFNSMSKAQDRNTNKLSKINKKKLTDDIESLLYEYQYNASAYDFTFTIYLATRSFTDATIIIEQIAPMFRPDISLKIWEIDIQREPTTVPVQIGDFDVELPDEMAEEDIRLVEVNFPLTVKGNLYLPISNQEIIKDIKLNMKVIESRRTDRTEKYGLDFETRANSMRSDTQTPKEFIPKNVDEIPLAKEKSGTVEKHFKNSGDIFNKDNKKNKKVTNKD